MGKFKKFRRRLKRALKNGSTDLAAALDYHTIQFRYPKHGPHSKLLDDILESDPAITDGRSAGTFILRELARSEELRQRFPRALSDGKTGAFADLLRSEGPAMSKAGPDFDRNIGAAFDVAHTQKAFTVLLFDEYFRRRYPLALLPPWHDVLQRRLEAAVREGKLDALSAAWALVEIAEDPQAQLIRTWKHTPHWQAQCPDALTVFGWARFASWLKGKFPISAQWLDPDFIPSEFDPAAQIRLAYWANPLWRQRHPDAFGDVGNAEAFLRWLQGDDAGLCPGAREWCVAFCSISLAAELIKPGLNVLGHFSYPSGLRASAEAIVEGLDAAQIPHMVRGVRVMAETDESTHDKFAEQEIFDVTLMHIQPEPYFPVVYQRAGVAQRVPRTYRVAYWYWELEDVPKHWMPVFPLVDELWCASRFIENAFRACFPGPIHLVPPGVELPAFQPLHRSHFGVPDTVFLFAFVFSMTSTIERKNPLAVIAAFQLAFPADDQVALFIKLTFGSHNSAGLEQLARAARGDPRIRIVDEVWDQGTTVAFMNTIDAYVSLHRSEGLGLTMAEAMLLGKPVIATRYSGNLDFMSDDNSLLVDFHYTDIDKDIPNYTFGAKWAEPSIEQAAEFMRKLYNDPVLARELGSRARADLRRRYSLQASAAKIQSRLAEIAGARRQICAPRP